MKYIGTSKYDMPRHFGVLHEFYNEHSKGLDDLLYDDVIYHYDTLQLLKRSF